jgi:NAD(P)-dependent dehydrogenase (short-subunit alcohol dehydrogenase family)
MTSTTKQPKVALVIGAGDSTGGAIAKRFAREGYIACVTRRSADKLQPLVDSIRAEGGQAFGFASDARKEEDVKALFEQIESEHGPIEVLVFNIGANVPCSILDETARKYFKIWEMACFSGFLNAQAAAQRMVTRGRGTILFTGATAGLRGSANFAAFAGAKHALRAWRKAWRANWGRATSMSPMWWWMAPSTPTSSARPIPRALCPERPGRYPQPRPHCRKLLAPAQPAARCLDV